MSIINDDLGNKILKVSWTPAAVQATTAESIRARMQEISEQQDELEIYIEHLTTLRKSSRDEYEKNLTALVGHLDANTWETDRAALEEAAKFSYSNKAANHAVNKWVDAFAPKILRADGIRTPGPSDYSRMVPAASLWLNRDSVPTVEEVEGIRRFAKATAFERYALISIMEYTLSQSSSYYLVVDTEQDRAMVTTHRSLPIDDEDFDDTEPWMENVIGSLEDVLVRVGQLYWYEDKTGKYKPHNSYECSPW